MRIQDITETDEEDGGIIFGYYSPRGPQCCSSPWYPSGHEPFPPPTQSAAPGALDR